MGLSIVTVLIALLVYVGYYRITNRGDELPESVRNAPIAELVWPGERFTRPPRQLVGQETPPAESITLKNNGIDLTQPRVVSADFASPRSSNPQVNSFATNSANAASASASLSKANTLAKEILASKPAAKLIQDPKVSLANSNVPLTGFPKNVADSARNTATSIAQPQNDPFGKIVTEPAANDFQSPVAVLPTSKLATSSPPTLAPRLAKSEFDSDLNVGTKPEPFLPLPGTFAAKPIAIADSTSTDSTRAGSPNAASTTTDSERDAEHDDSFVIPPRDFQPARSNKATEVNNTSTSQSFSIKPLRPSFAANPPEVVANEFAADDDFKVEVLTAEEHVAEPISNSSQKAESNSIGFQPALPSVSSAPIKNAPIETTPTKPIAHETTEYPNLGTLQPKVLAALIERDGQTTYRVEANEDFWAISQKCYGDGRFFRALYQFNESNVTSFEELNVGSEISIPQKKDLIKLWPRLCPRDAQTPVEGEFAVNESQKGRANENALVEQQAASIYETQPGDTLFEIARQRLGQASRYIELWRLNEVRLGGNVDHMTPLRGGIRLEMPIE